MEVTLRPRRESSPRQTTFLSYLNQITMALTPASVHRIMLLTVRVGTIVNHLQG